MVEGLSAAAVSVRAGRKGWASDAPALSRGRALMACRIAPPSRADAERTASRAGGRL